jgi:hypothetical protein
VEGVVMGWKRDDMIEKQSIYLHVCGVESRKNVQSNKQIPDWARTMHTSGSGRPEFRKEGVSREETRRGETEQRDVKYAVSNVHCC